VASPAGADAAFTLTTSADGVSLVVSNASFPVVQSYQVNTPTAQATLNSRQQASGYSAAPDPGRTVAELPPTLSAVICGQLAVNGTTLPGCQLVADQIPSYPFAYAQAGDPPQDKSFPAAHLHAEATQFSSSAQTTSGVSGAASATSTAHTIAHGDGSEDASADTSLDSLQLAAYLRLSGVRASASIHRAPDGTLTPSSTFEIGGLLVDGQQIVYRDGSFSLLGNLVPVPLPTQTVLDALSAVGVTATYLPESKTAGGVTSAGLMLSYQVPGAPSGIVPPLPPTPLPVGVGLPTTPTTVTYVLGRVAATGTYKAIPGGDSGLIGGTLPVSPVTTPSSGGPATAPATGGPSSSDTLAPGVANGGSLPSGTGTTPAVGSTTPPDVAAPVAAAAPASTPAARLSAHRPVTGHGADIYLAFVVAALAAFAGASAIRLLGVRHLWTS
jgi:hypothetical protein